MYPTMQAITRTVSLTELTDRLCDAFHSMNGGKCGAETVDNAGSVTRGSGRPTRASRMSILPGLALIVVGDIQLTE